MQGIQKIHQEAVRCARQFRRSESELLIALQQVDGKKVFRSLGYASLFEYATRALLLSESTAYAFITVSRKSIEVPEMQRAICRGTLSVSQTKRITSVIRPQNQTEWVRKAESLTQRELEREVVRENPKLAVREYLKPVAHDRVEMRLGISAELEKKLRRVQDVLSQNRKKAVCLEEALSEMIELFLDKKDPVRKAERIAKPSSSLVVRSRNASGKRSPIPAAVQHQVRERDKGKCVQCQASRWVHLHHKVPVSLGGTHCLENILTLCAAHHRMLHHGIPLSSSSILTARPG